MPSSAHEETRPIPLTPSPSFPTLLDPDHLRHVEAVHREIMTVRFPVEGVLGLAQAYVRSYTSPRIAGLLAHTGHMRQAPAKRATDTTLLMYELYQHGLDSDTGYRVVERLNQMHHRWRIRNEDYLGALGAFAVLIPRVIDRYAWRRLTGEERQAFVDWYRELGTRMGITEIPTTHAEFVETFRAYEVANVRQSEAGQRLMAANWDVLVSRLPAPLRPLRPLVRQVASVLIDEPARSALGFTQPGRVTTAAVTVVLRLRGTLLRNWRAVPISPATAARPSDIYPDGYTIEELGTHD